MINIQTPRFRSLPSFWSIVFCILWDMQSDEFTIIYTHWPNGDRRRESAQHRGLEIGECEEKASGSLSIYRVSVTRLLRAPYNWMPPYFPLWRSCLGWWFLRYRSTTLAECLVIFVFQWSHSFWRITTSIFSKCIAKWRPALYIIQGDVYGVLRYKWEFEFYWGFYWRHFHWYVVV